jgi:hypothetical protein
MPKVAEVAICPDSTVVYRLRVVLAGLSPLISGHAGIAVPTSRE